MKTRKKFNWLTALRRLAKRKTAISYSEHQALKTKAGNWPTCACSQLCKRLPRFPSGRPEDQEAERLGVRFCGYVYESDWDSALRTFLQIEARTAVLLRQMAKERKTK